MKAHQLFDALYGEQIRRLRLSHTSHLRRSPARPMALPVPSVRSTLYTIPDELRELAARDYMRRNSLA